MGTPAAGVDVQVHSLWVSGARSGLGSSSPIDAPPTSCNLDREDLTSRPLVERKRALDELQLIGPA
jgi:hypothetical protein